MTHVKSIAKRKSNIKKVSFRLESLDEGQLNSLLYARQLNMIGDFYDDNSLIKKATEIERGIVSQTPIVTTGFSLAEKGFIKANSAKCWPSLAGKYFDTRISNTRISGPTSFEQWEYQEMAICEQIERERRVTSVLRFSRRSELKKAYEKCTERVNYIGLLNSKLEDSAYQPLYNFLGNNAPTTAAVKAVLHKNFKGSLAQVTGLSSTTIDLWLTNGVIASSIKAGEESIDPLQAIQVLRENGITKTGVQAPFLVVLPIVLKAIALALTAINAFIAAFKDKDKIRLLAASESVGTPEWGPQESDWAGSGQLGSNSMIPLSLLALGLYLITKK